MWTYTRNLLILKHVRAHAHGHYYCAIKENQDSHSLCNFGKDDGRVENKAKA